VPESPSIGTDASAQHPAHQVADEDGDTLHADVQRGQVRAVGDDAVQPGVWTAPLLPGFTGRLDQPGGREAFDEVGDGRPDSR